MTAPPSNLVAGLELQAMGVPVQVHIPGRETIEVAPNDTGRLNRLLAGHPEHAISVLIADAPPVAVLRGDEIPRAARRRRLPSAEAVGVVPADGEWPLDRLLGRLAELNYVVRQKGHQWRARCPYHGGKSDTSLSIAEREDGKVALHCFGGCRAEEILGVMGMTFSDLYPTPAEGTRVAGGANGQGHQTAQRGQLHVTWSDTIKTKPIRWLWRNRIPYGKLTVIGGDPGMGKGMLGITIAAHVSSGRPWPDGSPCESGTVLLLTGEDDKEDTINPRLEVAEANRPKVGVIDGVSLDQGRHRRIDLAEDVQVLMDQANAMRARVVLVDPLSSYISAKANMWRGQDMRAILDPLADAAAKYGIAVIAVVHLNKGTGKAMYRFQDSIANVAAARAAYIVAPHPDNDKLRVLAMVKTNIAAPPPNLTFEIETLYHEGAEGDIGRVRWIGSSEMSADELMGEKRATTSGAIEKACAFLTDYLGDGGKPSEDVKNAARGQRIGNNALWEAKKAMSIRASKNGLGHWFWELPAETEAP